RALIANEGGLYFLQAEDGIRDRNVTGVQTCALPISACGRGSSLPPPARAPGRRRPASTCGRPAGSRRTSRSTGARSPRPRGGTRTRCASVLHLIDLEGQGLQATTVGGRDLLLVAPADVDSGEHAGVGVLGVTP